MSEDDDAVQEIDFQLFPPYADVSADPIDQVLHFLNNIRRFNDVAEQQFQVVAQQKIAKGAAPGPDDYQNIQAKLLKTILANTDLNAADQFMQSNFTVLHAVMSRLMGIMTADGLDQRELMFSGGAHNPRLMKLMRGLVKAHQDKDLPDDWKHGTELFQSIAPLFYNVLHLVLGSLDEELGSRTKWMEQLQLQTLPNEYDPLSKKQRKRLDAGIDAWLYACADAHISKLAAAGAFQRKTANDKSAVAGGSAVAAGSGAGQTPALPRPTASTWNMPMMMAFALLVILLIMFLAMLFSHAVAHHISSVVLKCCGQGAAHPNMAVWHKRGVSMAGLTAASGLGLLFGTVASKVSRGKGDAVGLPVPVEVPRAER